MLKLKISRENFLQEKISYERNRGSEWVGAMILATFLINIFFLVYYVNIQPSFSETRKEYFNIEIRLIIRET